MDKKNLLTQRIFLPFFGTMGLGAFNDNLFKSAIAIFITYSYPANESNQLVQLSAGLFILPFFLFSGISGQLCDKYEKSSLMIKVKFLELIVMIFGALAFINTSTPFLLLTLFLMGSQSTLFGPVKYSILPEHLRGDLLLKGNALTSMGTFIFILLGTILGGFLVEESMTRKFGHNPISASIILFSLVGLLFSLFIPKAGKYDPQKKISYNFFKKTIETMKLVMHNKETFESIIYISWFWFFGFFFMASLPIFCRDIIRGDE